MSTVLVIGNGFDLNLGLKTSYRDFFDSSFYPTKDVNPELRQILSNPLVRRGFAPFTVSVFDYLNAYRDLTNWCDIEGALGFLLSFFPNNGRTGFFISEDSFLELHNRFCDYLRDQAIPCFEDIDTDSVAYRLAKTLVRMPELSILNFNYTPTLEYIDSFYQKHVDYIHGSLNENSIIFGVEDDLEVPKEYSFLLKTFSPHYRGHNIRQQLQQADHIIIFGHSLAKADYHYFKDLFIRQTNPETALEKQIISIFTKDEQSKRDVLWQIRTMNENKSDYLFDLCKFQIFRTDNDHERLEEFFSALNNEKTSMHQVYSFDYL